MSALTLLKNVTHWRTGERFTLAVEDGFVLAPDADALVAEAEASTVSR